MEEKGSLRATDMEEKGSLRATDMEEKGSLRATDMEEKGSIYRRATDMEEKGSLYRATDMEEKGSLRATDVEEKGSLRATDMEEKGSIYRATDMEEKGSLRATDMEEKGSIYRATDMEEKGSIRATDVEEKGSIRATDMEEKGSIYRATDMEEKGSIYRATDMEEKGSIYRATDMEEKGTLIATDMEEKGSLYRATDMEEKGSIYRSLWMSLICFFCCIHICASDDTEENFWDFWNTSSDGVVVSSSCEWFLSSGVTTVFLPIVYMVVVVVGLPTNVLAVWVFLFRTKKKHPSSIYMANLALADLLFIVWIPLKISYHFKGNDWIYGPDLCKVLVAFFFGNMYCSVAFIACISVQRYWAVVYPMSQRHRSKCVAACVSLAVWVLVWLCTAPLYLYDQHLHDINLNICTCHDLILESQNKTAGVFFLTMVTLGFVVPSVVCIISYVLMLKALRNTMEDPVMAKKRRKAVFVLMVVLVMFLVCFVPSSVMLMVHYILLLVGTHDNLYGFYVTTLCLASLNSCLDPFLYYFISEDFREHVKNTFRCRSERTAQRMRVSFRALNYSSNKAM